jgi:hypothetical protein
MSDQGVNEIKPEHDALTVRHVDDFDHSENQVHAKGQKGKNSAQEKPV